jgi:hypothetical protein
MRNCLLLLVITLAAGCGRRPGPASDETEAKTGEALSLVERCRTEAKRCHDYAGSAAASTVCDQQFRSCLAGLVQDGGEAVGREAAFPPPQRVCIADVRTCLVAMSAPSTCANRASECLEASAKRRPR